jgi:very-short-patch-repair endonuclease
VSREVAGCDPLSRIRPAVSRARSARPADDVAQIHRSGWPEPTEAAAAAIVPPMTRRPGSPPLIALEEGGLPRIHRSADHLAGVPSTQLRSGEWYRVRRGVFVESASIPEDRYARRRTLALAAIAAVGRSLTGGRVVSHDSAALLWGLRLVAVPPVVRTTGPVPPCDDHADDVVRHVGVVPEGDRAEVAGVPVTSLVRTVRDSLLTADDGAHGLVVLDAGLRAGLSGDVADHVARATGRRGVRLARAVVPFGDDGAESVGESLARAALLGLGLAAPLTQVPVSTADGDYWSDLGWPEWRTVVEYDGRMKYGADQGVRALLQEKRREDLLRGEGWRVLRLDGRDLRTPALLLDRLRRVLPQGATTDLEPRPWFLRRGPRSLR